MRVELAFPEEMGSSSTIQRERKIREIVTAFQRPKGTDCWGLRDGVREVGWGLGED